MFPSDAAELPIVTVIGKETSVRIDNDIFSRIVTNAFSVFTGLFLQCENLVARPSSHFLLVKASGVWGRDSSRSQFFTAQKLPACSMRSILRRQCC